VKKNILIYIIFLAVSVVGGALFVTRDSLQNVNACVQAPGCIDQNKQPLGKQTVKSYGFPATYRQVVVFEPTNNKQSDSNYAGYASASAEIKAVKPLIVVNIIFWFALLYAGYSLAIKFKKS